MTIDTFRDFQGGPPVRMRFRLFRNERYGFLSAATLRRVLERNPTLRNMSKIHIALVATNWRSAPDWEAREVTANFGSRNRIRCLCRSFVAFNYPQIDSDKKIAADTDRFLI